MTEQYEEYRSQKDEVLKQLVIKLLLMLQELDGLTYENFPVDAGPAFNIVTGAIERAFINYGPCNLLLYF